MDDIRAVLDAVGSERAALFGGTQGGRLCALFAATYAERTLALVLHDPQTERAAALGDRGWRDLLARHHAAVRRELSRFRGQELDTAGDGFFATFDGPARAIRCAQAIIADVGELGLGLRAGLHTGECELHDDKVTGIAVGVVLESPPRPRQVRSSSRARCGISWQAPGSSSTTLAPARSRGGPGEWRRYAVRA